MNDKEHSPFTPGSPVPVELFVGRSKQIEKLLSYVDQSISGRSEHVFLIGDRGIGKSSLASWLRYYVTAHKDLLGTHIFLGRVNTLEDMVRHTLDQILKETRVQRLEELLSLFGGYVKEVGLFAVTITFSPPEDKLKELVRRFPEVLNNIVKRIQGKRSGLFIVLDDINGLVEKSDFANWYKSFADEIATHYKKYPVFIMLTGLAEKRDVLARYQPSLMRIFRIVEIERLSNEEVRQFFMHAFDSVGVKVKIDAIEAMVDFSGGFPLLMHEIGDATFRVDRDSLITLEDAYAGILEATEEVGRKYLDPKLYELIRRSKRYRSIIRKLGETPSRKFKKKEIETRLSESERKVFNNFLKRLRELDIIETDPEGGKGAYRFVNELYPLYFWIRAKVKEKGR